jgi:hypothetical protein
MHLPIPASEQIRAAHHAVWTDILNAQRRCAPQAELNALEDRKQALHAVDDQIKAVLGHFRAARALREISSAPNPDAVAHREKYMAEAGRSDALAYAVLRDVYAVLNLPTQ